MSNFDGKLDSLSGYKPTTSSPPPSSSSFINELEKQDRKEDNNNIDNNKENNHQHSIKQQKEDKSNNNGNGNPKRITVFKYTLQNQLHESIILKGVSAFVTINKNDDNDYDLNFLTEIEETTRTLKPPAIEEYPSSELVYSFENKEELQDILSMIKDQQISIDSLFFMIRKYVSKFIVHHDYVLDYISALILFSYFQDKSPTVPYSMFVSDNGSGKSTIGNVFESWPIDALT